MVKGGVARLGHPTFFRTVPPQPPILGEGVDRQFPPRLGGQGGGGVNGHPTFYNCTGLTTRSRHV